MIFKLLVTLLTLSMAAPTYAQIFRLNFIEDAGELPAPVLAAFEAEIQKTEDEINKGLPSASTPDRLMEGMANSSVMSGKGVGSDYASNMSVFLLGAGVGVGADLEKNEDADADLSGAGLQGGLVLGTNLSWLDTQTILGLDTNRLNVYVNFFKYDHEMETGDTKAKIDLNSYGVHFSYDWIKPRGNVLLGWGGVKVHWGYEYNKTKLRFDSQINETVTTEVGGNSTYTSTVNANPFATIDVATHSIPLEISTSIQFLYFVSLYAGLGADYNMGEATGKGDLNSSNTPVTCTGAGCVGDGGDGNYGEIETDANIDGKGEVNPFLFRGFAGVQFNLPFVRVFVQADKALGNDLVGATAGVRLVY
jgi:hypothetical protein